MTEKPAMTAQEFRVWCLRDAAATIRGDVSVREAVAHLQDIADRLELMYIEDATNAVLGPVASESDQ